MSDRITIRQLLFLASITATDGAKCRINPSWDFNGVFAVGGGVGLSRIIFFRCMKEFFHAAAVSYFPISGWQKRNPGRKSKIRHSALVAQASRSVPLIACASFRSSYAVFQWHTVRKFYDSTSHFCQSTSMLSDASRSVMTSSRARKYQSVPPPPVSVSIAAVSFKTLTLALSEAIDAPAPVRSLEVRDT